MYLVQSVFRNELEMQLVEGSEQAWGSLGREFHCSRTGAWSAGPGVSSGWACPSGPIDSRSHGSKVPEICPPSSMGLWSSLRAAGMPPPPGVFSSLHLHISLVSLPKD